MKKLLFIAMVCLCISATGHAQKVKFKKGKVLVDGVECLNYESSSTNVELTTLDGDHTIILKYIRTGVGHNGGLYTKVVFVEEDKSFTSKSYIFNKNNLTKKLMSDGVINNCSFDESKVDKFVMKYDERIEDTLVRH